MTWEQMYYTSCRTGLGSGTGFQVQAASPGMDAATCQQVERVGTYVPPSSAPSRPSSEELERFPVSLLYHRLADGRALLAQSRYVARDFTGRYGNYFLHALVAAEPDVLPICLWRAPFWSCTESESQELPVLEQLAPGQPISLEAAAETLRAPSRAGHVAELLSAVLQALGSSRRVVLIDEGDAVAHWIAFVSYVLPRRLALRITFNTYARNPHQSNALVTGTTVDGDFTFSSTEMDYQFFVFDFVGSRFSRIEPVSQFALAVEAALRQGRLEGLGASEDDLEVGDLDAAFAFRSLARGAQGIACDVVAVLDWCRQRLERLHPEDVGRALPALLRGGDRGRSASDALIRLYARAGDSEIEPEVREVVEYGVILWSSQVALDDAPLTRLLAGLRRPSERVRDVAEPVWQQELERCEDARRCLQLLRLGEGAGLRAGSNEVGRLLASFLHDRDVQGHALDRLEDPLLLQGLVRALADEPPALEDPLWTSAAAVLTRPTVLRALERESSPPLLLGLGRARAGTDGEDRVAVYRDLCARVGRDERAWDAVWAGGVPTPGEALALLASDDFRGAKELEAAAAALEQAADFSRPQPECEEVAGCLASRKPRLSEARRLVVHTFCLLSRLEREDVLAELASCASRLPERLAVGLMARVGAVVATVENVTAQRRAVHKLWMMSGFSGAYRRAVDVALRGDGRGVSLRAARYFRVWIAGPDDLDREPWSVLAREALGRALSRRCQEEIGDILESQGVDPRLWSRWRERYASRGLVASLKRLFGVS